MGNRFALMLVLLAGCGAPSQNEDAGAVDAGDLADAGALDDGGAGAVDAGRDDAGPSDAGTTDAGVTDAGVTDAGVSDAGVPDAGVSDAGHSDAGVSDAGRLDAGVRDAGVVDAGPFDAGPLSLSPPSATVAPHRTQGWTVQGGVRPWSWSLPTNGSSGSLVALPEATSIAAAPLLAGAAQWQQWGHGQPVVVRDNHGDHELFTFGSPGSPAGKLHLLRSADLGVTWSWVVPDSYAQSVASDANASLMAVAQDSAGTVHLLYFRSGSLDVAYYRLTLTYAGGAITGYTGFTGPLTIPGTYAGDRRAMLRPVITGNGAEVLAVLVAGTDSGGSHLQGSVCLTTTLAPSSSADFKNLAGAANAATMVIDDARGPGGSHDHHLLFAQLGVSRDLWIFAGNMPAEQGPTAPTTLGRVRLSASGATWTAGPQLDGTTTDAWLMGVEGSAHFVWAMYGRYADGAVRFARVNELGVFEEPVASIPSPVSDGRIEQTQFGVFTVNPDERRLWAVYTRDPGPTGHWYDFTPTAASWDGARWQLQLGGSAGGSGAVAYAEGLAGTFGWTEGVVGLMTRTDGTSFNAPIWLVTARAPGALYTAGATGGTTDLVRVNDAQGASATATVTVP